MMAIVCSVPYHISYRLAMYAMLTVASHMEANAALYRGFVCQPVATNSKYNADTEPPTDEDEYINSVSDPELQTQLRWAKYVRRLRQGAWGG